MFGKLGYRTAEEVHFRQFYGAPAVVVMDAWKEQAYLSRSCPRRRLVRSSPLAHVEVVRLQEQLVCECMGFLWCYRPQDLFKVVTSIYECACRIGVSRGESICLKFKVFLSTYLHSFRSFSQTASITTPGMTVCSVSMALTSKLVASTSATLVRS